MSSENSRRQFLTAAGSAAALAVLPDWRCAADTPPVADSPHIIGPRAGYAPQVGTLVSMLDWMRRVVLDSAQGLSRTELDFLLDAKANSIGALLLHLAAIEAFYQATTFDGRKEFNAAEAKRWNAAMNLGAEGRQRIKGQELSYYLSALEEVRARTLSELRRRDDAWLMAVDPSFFGKLPTNNHCKWFHVCEHESNHNGQIKWVRSRLPGAPDSGKD